MLKRLLTVAILAISASYAQQTSKPRIGTLTRVERDGREQVYVITGEGMEYVVTESKNTPAHVVINDAIAYWLEGDRFYFLDREGLQHPVRILQQTLIDPNLRAATIPVIIPIGPPVPTIWKEPSSGERFTVRRSQDSLYAEQIMGPHQKAMPVRIDAMWNGDQYVGRRYWVEGKCSFSREIDLKASVGRIDGSFLAPLAGDKLDRRNCRYKQPMHIAPLHWVPE